jgi:hypothetical protein
MPKYVASADDGISSSQFLGLFLGIRFISSLQILRRFLSSICIAKLHGQTYIYLAPDCVD